MRPYMTYTLILLNTVIHLMQYVIPMLTILFTMVPAEILVGQNLITLVTSTFLHADFFHLFVNMYFLFIFGTVVEGEMHPFSYLALYIVAGFIGSLGHVLITATLGLVFDPMGMIIPALGASGAIFGVMAAYAYLLPRRPLGVYGDSGRTTAAWNIIIIYFILELFQMFLSFGSGVAHGAHVFGFVGGFIFAFLYRFIRIQRTRMKPEAQYDPYEYYV
jgi:membrane associated rhomboid family serine protease